MKSIEHNVSHKIKLHNLTDDDDFVSTSISVDAFYIDTFNVTVTRCLFKILLHV